MTLYAVPNVRHWSVSTEWPLKEHKRENSDRHTHNCSREGSFRVNGANLKYPLAATKRNSDSRTISVRFLDQSKKKNVKRTLSLSRSSQITAKTLKSLPFTPSSSFCAQFPSAPSLPLPPTFFLPPQAGQKPPEALHLFKFIFLQKRGKLLKVNF